MIFFLVDWSNLLIFIDFQLLLLVLSSRLLSFHSSEPLLPKPPKIKKWTGSASLKTGGFKHGSQMCWEGLDGRRDWDSAHSSDRLAQLQSVALDG